MQNRSHGSLQIAQQHTQLRNPDLRRVQTISGKNGITQAGADAIKKYQISPRSSTAKAWHARELNREEQPNLGNPVYSTTQCNISLINMQGLITNKKNKSQILKLKCTKGGNNVVAVTETHLIKDKHYDEEIRKSFPGYSLERADRDVKEKKAKKTNSAARAGPSSEESGEAEDDRLQSGGGCLLLASPGLTLLPIDTVRNGVCELLICEVPQLNMAANVAYNPPKPNFSLPNFKEIACKNRGILGEE